MGLRKAIRRLHRWVGLAAGPLVLVIGLSGSVLVFEQEIRDRLQDYRHVAAARGSMLPPSRLRAIAEQELPGEKASRVYYEGPRRSAYVQFGDKKTAYYNLAYIDPYDGRVLKVKDMNGDLLHIVFSLHYRLLIRPDIGTTVIDCATLLFVLSVASGLVNWWPRSRAAIRKRLSVQWRVGWRRTNYDLHSVVAFYACPLLLIIALTGLVWGFAWFEDAVFWIASGGESRQASQPPVSPSLPASGRSAAENVDIAWRDLARRYPDAETMIVFFPATAQSPIRCVVNPERATYYKTDHYHFDQNSLTGVGVEYAWGLYDQASAAGIVRRVNYDMHIGAILGLPGKLAAFIASMIAATLPVTGALIWWNKRSARLRRRDAARPATQQLCTTDRDDRRT